MKWEQKEIKEPRDNTPKAIQCCFSCQYRNLTQGANIDLKELNNEELRRLNLGSLSFL